VLSGPARIRIGDERMDVSEGAAIRIPSETPRQVFNDTDEEHRWLIVGAPPVENDGRDVEE
jgi:mannose-6-phosphate isomerase-like protein (cupin superfamily)